MGARRCGGSEKEMCHSLGRVSGPYENRSAYVKCQFRSIQPEGSQKPEKYGYLFIPLELCYPVRLNLSPGYNYKREAATLELESVAILARFPDYVPERHLLADLQ